jgi:hypothetical protein
VIRNLSFEGEKYSKECRNVKQERSGGGLIDMVKINLFRYQSGSGQLSSETNICPSPSPNE